MRKRIYLFVNMFVFIVSLAQTKGITYQAVIYDPEYKTQGLPGPDNGLLPFANKSVCLQFEITDVNSKSVYIETQSATTDQFGMVNLIIGHGNRVGGTVADFAAINWDSQINGLIVGIDTGLSCTSFKEVSNQPFTAIPFSFAATSIDSSKFELSANKSNNIVIDATSTTKYPTVAAIKTYIDNLPISIAINDASPTAKGQIQLAGDLGGTAGVPRVNKIQNAAVSPIIPLSNQFLKYDGNFWKPTYLNSITQKSIAEISTSETRSFTLNQTPITKPSFFINGVRIVDDAITMTIDNKLVYDSTKNGNFLIDVGDVIEIIYQY